MFRSHLMRLRKNRISRFSFVFLLILPSLEIVEIMMEILSNSQVPRPDPLFCFFLACYSRSLMFQSVLYWFLPMYFLILVSDDAIQDFKTGYHNILFSKIGKKKYCFEKVTTAFVVSSLTMLLSLALNFLLVSVLFKGETYQYVWSGLSSAADFEKETLLFRLGIQHPLLADIGFTIVTCFISGLCGSLGAAFSLFFRNKLYTYTATFVVWFTLMMQMRSPVLLFQPFAEYDFHQLLPIFLNTVLLLGGTIGAILFHEIRINDYE